MEGKVINYLINEIILNLKEDYYFRDIEELIREFVRKQNIELTQKRHVIELLYLYKVYKNGYISLDPRYIEKTKFTVKQVLNAKNSIDLTEKIKQLEDVINLLKEAENNPLQTTRKRIEDEEKYGNSMF